MKKKHLLFFILFMQTLFFKSHAAKFTVTNSGDNVVGGLRYLLDNAGSGDTIVFAQTLVGATITLSSNIIVIDKDITIIGPGEDKLSVSNSLTSTLFNIEPFANVFIKGIKILSCGDYDQILQNDVSGAIYNQGNLTLKQVTFNDNQTGAIYNKGTIYMERVTLYANYTQGDRYPGRASGLFNRGTATIKECIFDYNISDGSSVNPTGIRNSGTMYIEKTSITRGWSAATSVNEIGTITNSGTLQLVNCTISGNYLSSGMSSSCSGGIYNSGNLNIEYCTITDNTFSSYISEGGSNGPNRSYKASGIYNKGVLSLKGTILAHNGPSDIYYSYYGGVNYVEEADGITTTPIKDYGYNVIGVNNGLNLKTTNNILGSSNDFYDPFLERLKNNGGFSETHALSDSSRCIDAGGTSATVLVDQRGVLRSKPDVGAFEHVYEPWSVGTSIVYSDWNDLKLTATFNHKETRLEVTHVPGYKKLKLGYDNIGLYHANKNVISGGNDTLEILLYSYGIVDWNRIEIRPNGSTSNPISLGKYVDNFGSLPYHLKIPLSDFDSSIDFSQLILLEFPYSNNANSFKINIHKIAFTGGTEPFLWFGDGKVDNKFDGGGTGGQLLAKLYMQTSLDQIAKVEYFANSVKIGESSTAPFTFDWEDVESGEFEFVTVAHTVHGSILRSSPYKVNVGTRVYREATEESIESTQVEVYPNPIVDILNIKSANQNARVVIRDINGAIQYQVRYYNLQNGQADISSLPSGLYFLKLEDEGNVSNKVIKLIKQ